MYEVDQGIGAYEAFARARSRIADAPSWGTAATPGSELVHVPEDRGAREQISQLRETSGPPYAWVIRHLLQRGQIGAARRILEVALATAPNLEQLQSLARALKPPSAHASVPALHHQHTTLGVVRQVAALHRGKWVAVFGEELIGVDDSLPRLLAEIRAKQLPGRPVIHREST